VGKFFGGVGDGHSIDNGEKSPVGDDDNNDDDNNDDGDDDDSSSFSF